MTINASEKNARNILESLGFRVERIPESGKQNQRRADFLAIREGESYIIEVHQNLVCHFFNNQSSVFITITMIFFDTRILMALFFGQGKSGHYL